MGLVGILTVLMMRFVLSHGVSHAQMVDIDAWSRRVLSFLSHRVSHAQMVDINAWSQRVRAVASLDEVHSAVLGRNSDSADDAVRS